MYSKRQICLVLIAVLFVDSFSLSFLSSQNTTETVMMTVPEKKRKNNYQTIYQWSVNCHRSDLLERNGDGDPHCTPFASSEHCFGLPNLQWPKVMSGVVFPQQRAIIAYKS